MEGVICSGRPTTSVHDALRPSATGLTSTDNGEKLVETISVGSCALRQEKTTAVRPIDSNCTGILVERTIVATIQAHS